jgi:histidinol-phosphate aminotransferase
VDLRHRIRRGDEGLTVEPNPHLRLLERAAEDMRGRERFVRLDRNERVTPFPSAEFAAMLSTLRPEMFCAYPDPWPLVERLSTRLGLPPEWVSLTNGSDAAIRKLFQTYLRPADVVLLANPSYAMYPIYTQMFGGTADFVSYRPDRTLDLSLVHEKLAGRPRIVALAYPDQPTGAIIPLDKLREMVADAHRHDVLCIIDEAYFPFHPLTAVGFVSEFDNLVVTRTFSKVGGLAGLRLGYFVAQPEVIGAVDRVRGAHEVNAVAIQMGCFMLDHPAIGDSFVRDIEAGRAVLAGASAQLGLGFPPSPANFQLLELPAGLDPVAVVEALRARGYLVKGGFEHPSVERCIRVTLAGPDVIGPFVDALREVCAHARV